MAEPMSRSRELHTYIVNARLQTGVACCAEIDAASEADARAEFKLKYPASTINSVEEREFEADEDIYAA